MEVQNINQANKVNFKGIEHNNKHVSVSLSCPPDEFVKSETPKTDIDKRISDKVKFLKEMAETREQKKLTSSFEDYDSSLTTKIFKTYKGLFEDIKEQMESQGETTTEEKVFDRMNKLLST